jgi:hypothetical protein
LLDAVELAGESKIGLCKFGFHEISLASELSHYSSGFVPDSEKRAVAATVCCFSWLCLMRFT